MASSDASAFPKPRSGFIPLTDILPRRAQVCPYRLCHIYRPFHESNPRARVPRGLILAVSRVVEDESENLSRSAYGSRAGRRLWYLEFLAIEVQQMLHVHPCQRTIGHFGRCPRSGQRKYSLNSNVKTGAVEGFKYNLSGVFTVLRGVQRLCAGYKSVVCLNDHNSILNR
jgi:hypothetical protein